MRFFFASIAGLVPVVAASVPTVTQPAALKARATTGAGDPITALAGGSGVGGTTCTVTNQAEASEAVSSCSNILLSGVTVEASSTLSLEVPTSGALLFAGTMTVEYTPDSSFTPITISGKKAKVAGLEGAVIDGQGAKYWDGSGSGGGVSKPDHFMKLIDLDDSTFEELTIQNWPTHGIDITHCNDLTISNIIMNNTAGAGLTSDGVVLAHNSDGFDINNVDGLYLSGAHVINQDDCVAVSSGSNMVFEHMYCDGSHGLSIGSISSGVTVSNITFKDSTVVNGQNGVRIKTDYGDSDSTVSHVTYSNIYVHNITAYAIDIQQDYQDGNPTGDPTDGIAVSNIVFDGITGEVGKSSAYEYYILCGSTSSCENITFTNVDVTGGKTLCSPSSVCTGV
ncbi:glycoside hydrolase [Aspergillus multicolor]|uniref:glycoside hydrolase n=1 Tax=Aspergillus multicolor TaxID=41759 RepID=UPI003CCDAC84